jgi:hypothetical protein
MSAISSLPIANLCKAFCLTSRMVELANPGFRTDPLPESPKPLSNTGDGDDTENPTGSL